MKNIGLFKAGTGPLWASSSATCGTTGSPASGRILAVGSSRRV